MKRQADKRVIVGLGTTGLSVARFLARQGLTFAVVDSRKNPPGLAELKSEFPDVEVHLGDFNTVLMDEAGQLIVSPGVAVATPEISSAIETGAEVLGDIELFARYVEKPVIAITGSNGKSTVTALLGEMVKAAGVSVGVGGNIGTPALDLLVDENIELFVMELSSFQLETTSSLQAQAAVVLNVSPDHMDRYPSFDAYKQAKAVVYQKAKHCVINRDEPESAELAGDCDCISYGLDEPVSDNDFGLRMSDNRAWLVHGNELLCRASEIHMPGRHNVSNVLAAMALAYCAGINDAQVIEAAKNFPGLPHRCEWVGEWNGVSWFNDSKGTNVGATVAALQGLQQTVVLIAGGQAKGAEFSALAEAIEGKSRAVVLFGEDAGQIEVAIAGRTKVIRADDLAEAVQQAKSIAQNGDAVLFSPACASFDMFDNYLHRGESFLAEVRRIQS
ncbi:MAG: UDP-N-acetylmuramoyl-L-alanine--D-glutamate ligase [Gammaproteobacteria bacterium]|nr:UDP-N-acetylmuramoyl-L-alanine--D-glutamate ligase [Gammaproteobacteria bacterium]